MGNIVPRSKTTFILIIVIMIIIAILYLYNRWKNRKVVTVEDIPQRKTYNYAPPASYIINKTEPSPSPSPSKIISNNVSLWDQVKDMDKDQSIIFLNTHNHKLGNKLPGFYWPKITKTDGENITRLYLSELFQKPFIKQKLDNMKNPKTGRKLEFDAWCAELNMAAEYNGPQHYEWPNYTNNTYQQYCDQRYRDEIKRKHCETNNVLFIKIKYTIPLDKIHSYIYCKLLDYVRISHPVLINMKTDDKDKNIITQNEL